MLRGKGIKAVDGISESTRITNMLPCQSSQTGCKTIRLANTHIIGSRMAKKSVKEEFDLLQRGVIGVLIGLTRTLSR